VFLLAELLADAGVAQGLEPDAAVRLANQTVIGAARLLDESHDDAATLRANVTSPGGTTAAALASFAADDLAAVIERAVRAASARSRELGAG
jgi:pyrroline-5-carboxylate reductase